MFDWLRSWRLRRNLRKIVRQLGVSLKKRYGFQEYYTPEQVLKTAELAGLDREAQAYGIAMYVQPEKAVSILTTMGNAKWAEGLRVWMIGQCFGFGGGYDDSLHYNVFIHHSSVAEHGHGGGFFDGSDGGGHSGGHAGGDSGGGGHH